MTEPCRVPISSGRGADSAFPTCICASHEERLDEALQLARNAGLLHGQGYGGALEVVEGTLDVK